MFRLQPRYDHFTQFTGEGGQFLGLFGLTCPGASYSAVFRLARQVSR